MSGLAVDFDKFIAAYEKGIGDNDIIIDGENVIYETSTSHYRNESDFNKQRNDKRNGKNKRRESLSANAHREFALPIDYAKQRKPIDTPVMEIPRSTRATTEVQEMPVVKLNELTVEVVSTPNTFIDIKPLVAQPVSLISQYVVANNRIDLINLSEASVIAPMLKAVGKSLYVPFALELCEVGEIRSETCIDNEVWGEMCPVEIKGIGGAIHTVNLPASSGIYIAPTYLAKQLGDVFILRNSSFTMDLMMRRDSGQIEIGHKLQSPLGTTYGTVIHYGTIASHQDTIGEVWMLVQRITDGWHVPTKPNSIKTVLTGSTQIAKLATPSFDARLKTSEAKAVVFKPEPIVKPTLIFDAIGGKGFDPHPMSI